MYNLLRTWVNTDVNRTTRGWIELRVRRTLKAQVFTLVNTLQLEVNRVALADSMQSRCLHLAGLPVGLSRVISPC